MLVQNASPTRHLSDRVEHEATAPRPSRDGGQILGCAWGMVETLEPGERERFHDAYVAYNERFRTGGGVAVPREYLLVLGRRR